MVNRRQRSSVGSGCSDEEKSHAEENRVERKPREREDSGRTGGSGGDGGHWEGRRRLFEAAGGDSGAAEAVRREGEGSRGLCVRQERERYKSSASRHPFFRFAEYKIEHEFVNLAIGNPKSQLHISKQGSVNSAGTNTVLPDSDKLLSLKRKQKTTAAIVRKSGRIQHNSRHQPINPFAKEIIVSDTEKDEPPVHENQSPEGTPDEAGRSSPDGIPGAADSEYRRMDIDSRKKIQTLMDENIRLRKKLENAFGKLEVCEKWDQIYLEIWTIFSSMSKTTETEVSLCAEAMHSALFEKAEVAVPGAAKWTRADIH